MIKAARPIFFPLRIVFLWLAAFCLAIAAYWANASESGNEIKIVVLGDSLSAGYQLPPQKGFVPRLQAALDEKGENVRLVSAAVSGDTTSGGLARLDWSVPQGVHGVILELGANDALRGLPVESARANLDSILERLHERNIQVLLAGMLAPPNMGEEYGARFNALYPELAARHNAVFFPFFLEGVAADPALNLEDGIHPNEEGIEVIVRNISPFVDQLVAKISAEENQGN